MVAEAKQGQKPAAAMRTVGVCEPMANLPEDPYFGRVGLSFAAVATNYLFDYEKVNLTKQTAKVTLLQLPAHGELTEVGDRGAVYKPARGFFGGQDQVSALVELGGYQVKVIYFIKVQPEGTGGIPNDNDELIKKFCGPKGRVWKISTTTPASQTLIGTNNGVVSDTSPYQLNSFTVTFGDLTGGAVGQTTGTGPTAQITLDPTAAGHGWYIDPTPLDTTDDYLPTSDANVWQATLQGGTLQTQQSDFLGASQDQRSLAEKTGLVVRKSR